MAEELFLFTASVSAVETPVWSAPPLPRAAANSNGGHAAIDGKFHARDEACFVRSEEQGGRSLEGIQLGLELHL
jgi:hypothetical protein